MKLFPSLPGARHRLLAPLAGALAAGALLLVPSLASADSSSTLTIDGTSDVSDSGLIQNVIQPAFQAAFPQYKFTYNGSATGTAIGNVEAGTGGPSMLIVHAQSLENQFVQQGFSLNNQPGNALFDNDFVVIGTRPTVTGGDPAAVLANDPNNGAQAFADIATQGAAGNDFFVSRGGTTTASGTTVQEHAIWAVVQQANLAPGISFCAVSTADGGGASPIVGTSPAAGGACPDAGTVSGADAPAWYLINTGANQAANILATNACTVGGTAHTANTCYSLTDRATYDFLTTQANPNPAGTPPTIGTVNQIPNLGILARDNAATAPGGPNLLINYFHAYIVNPNKPNETPNVPAAQAFISVVTSPTVQAAVARYLSVLNPNAGDTGSPFKPTASPATTATGIPTTATAGQTVTVSGQVTNLQPGFAAIANQPVTVDEIEGGLPVPVKAGTTNATGGYSIAFTPPSSGSYEVSTGSITLLENPALQYSDILSPGTSAPTSLALTAASTLVKVSTSAGTVSAAGTLLPAAPDANAQATLLARPSKSTGAFKVIGSQALTQGQLVYAINGALKGGKWTVEVQYSDPGQLTAAATAPKTVTVPANSVTVKFSKVKNKQGKVTITGKLSQAPTTSGATVKLFALNVGTVKVTKTKATKKKKGTKKGKKAVRIVAAAKSATFTQVGKVSVKKGKTTFTLSHKFARGHSYALQLRYLHKGQTTIPSGFKSLDVH
jgi:ABC-type tungstate transport system permease subunit